MTEKTTPVRREKTQEEKLQELFDQVHNIYERISDLRDELGERISDANERISDVQVDFGRRMRLLIHILVDEKVITDEMAKPFMETKDVGKIDDILKWYLDKEKKRSQK